MQFGARGTERVHPHCVVAGAPLVGRAQGVGLAGGSWPEAAGRAQLRRLLGAQRLDELRHRAKRVGGKYEAVWGGVRLCEQKTVRDAM